MEMMNFFLQLETSVQISLTALLISGLSFIVSLRANVAKSALDRATKKTEISIKLLETTLILNNLFDLLSKMSPTQDDCIESTESMKNDIKEQIADCEKLSKNIENAPFIIGATILEKNLREAQKQYLRAKELVPRAENMSTKCINNHKKAKVYFDNLPEEKRPKFDCTIHRDSPLTTESTQTKNTSEDG